MSSTRPQAQIVRPECRDLVLSYRHGVPDQYLAESPLVSDVRQSLDDRVEQGDRVDRRGRCAVGRMLVRLRADTRVAPLRINRHRMTPSRNGMRRWSGPTYLQSLAESVEYRPVSFCLQDARVQPVP